MSDDHPLVCRFGAFGDMVLITPLLRQLYRRTGLPCDLVGIGDWNQLLFQQMPWVRDVFTINSRAAPYWFNRSQRELVRQLRQRRHRYVWICETNEKSYRLLARAGIHRETCATQLDLSPVEDEHYCETWLRLGQVSPPGFNAALAEANSTGTELFVSEEERRECHQWLQSRGLDPSRPLICIQAGSKRTTRRGRVDRASNTKYWPVNYWAHVIDAVVHDLPGAQLLLCGVAAEMEMCRDIEAKCRSTGQVQAVADDLPLRRLLTLLSLAHSCISVDTGPAHAAAALNCPLVVLFGKANPARFQPRSLTGPVEVLQGFPNTTRQSEPDISCIKPDQVLNAWRQTVQISIE